MYAARITHQKRVDPPNFRFERLMELKPLACPGPVAYLGFYIFQTPNQQAKGLRQQHIGQVM